MNKSKLKFCKKCFTPNSRPRIKFDLDGVCNACTFYKKREGSIDFENRKKELIELCDKYRSKSGQYDCIVPWSGGKDSSAIAHKLKANNDETTKMSVKFRTGVPSADNKAYQFEELNVNIKLGNINKKPFKP